MLLQAYPDAASCKRLGEHPLHLALKKGASEAVVQMLLQAYPAAASCSPGGRYPLHLALDEGASEAVVRMLLQAYPAALYGEGQVHPNVAPSLPYSEDGLFFPYPLQMALKHKATDAVVQMLFQAYAEASRNPHFLLAMACTFAARQSLSGVSHLVSKGINTLEGFRSAVGIDIGTDMQLTQHSRFRCPAGVTQTQVQFVLRSWHKGSLLWCRFVERTLAKVVKNMPACIIRKFLLGREHSAAGARQATESRIEQLCIESVEHQEPAVQTDETDEIISEHLWAQNVERCILAGLHEAAWSSEPHSADLEADPTSGASAVYLLRFGSASAGGNSWHDFVQTVLESKQFTPYIKALRSHGLAVQSPEGVLMLLKPEQYSDVRRALVGKQTLHEGYVVIDADCEDRLEEILASLPSKRRPKKKHGSKGRCPILPIAVEDVEHSSAKHSHMDSVVPEMPTTEDICYELSVERTFLYYAPVPVDSRTVIQSTTEVEVLGASSHYGHSRGSNPRRSMRGSIEHVSEL
mmetsp:Transcript_114894/g.228681  ORF Transcript_114894/g.228681 Transcript_114894/m.228681 type:complete len:521 (-) Transcript_114894:321-1883(-)